MYEVEIKINHTSPVVVESNCKTSSMSRVLAFAYAHTLKHVIYKNIYVKENSGSCEEICTDKTRPRYEFKISSIHQFRTFLSFTRFKFRHSHSSSFDIISDIFLIIYDTTRKWLIKIVDDQKMALLVKLLFWFCIWQ